MNLQPLGNGHRRITVMGLGLFGGGLGAARFWSELGSIVTVTDLHSREELAPSVEALKDTSCNFVLGEHREKDFLNADLVVVNPAVRPDNKYVRLARNAGAKISTEIGLALRLITGPYIAVTGSNGKSTTTALIGSMLRAHNPESLTGGNIGGSLLPALKTHMPSTPLVMELSSFQLHYLKEQRIAPTVAVVTNLSPNHLDWHKTVLSYYEDKRNLVQFQYPEEWAVLNGEDETLLAWAPECQARVVLASRKDPGVDDVCFVRDEGGQANIVIRLSGRETTLAQLSSLKLKGGHNVMNALQAAAAVYVFCQNKDAVETGMTEFSGLAHRLEVVGKIGGVSFVNDSIATTPESAICALEAYSEETGKTVLIAGGYDKGMGFDALAEAIHKHADAVVLIGQTAESIKDALEKAENGFEKHAQIIEAGEDFQSAVKLAYEAAGERGSVILSPACASYDMFTNFQERGEKFRRSLESLR